VPSNSINFDRAASYYDETRGFPAGVEEQVGAFIAQSVNLDANSRVLEVGVGTGRIALPLSPHLNGSVLSLRWRVYCALVESCCKDAKAFRERAKSS
jgi:ubiquinone/menaquinone biosynthesis C-methylase UbiE